MNYTDEFWEGYNHYPKNYIVAQASQFFINGWNEAAKEAEQREEAEKKEYHVTYIKQMLHGDTQEETLENIAKALESIRKAIDEKGGGLSIYDLI